jgi:hypothetical protein
VPDLDLQIREYFDSTSSPLTVEDVSGTQVRSATHPLRPYRDAKWRRRGWLVAAASFGVVLLVGGGMALIAALSGESSPVTENPAPAVTITVAPTPPPTTAAPPPTTAVSTEPTPTIAEPVITSPITGCMEWYTEWLGARGRDCDLVQGEEVPTVFGPLLDGGWFDLTELRGRPAVVLTWVASYGPGNRDALAEFQILYDKWSDQVGFVSISEDAETNARQAVEDGGFTFPVATCFSDEPIPPNNSTLLCGPQEEEFLWVWWGNQDLPSWTVLDSDGRFVDIRFGGTTTVDDIDSLLASVVGS